MKSLIHILLLLIIFGIMFTSQTLYYTHQENNKTFDIYNFTENNFVWNYTQEKEAVRNNLSGMSELDYGKIQSKRITNLIEKFIDFLGYSLIEISKWTMEFGYTHPEYDFSFFMNFVLYWLLAMITIAIFPIIIPLLALIYLIIIIINKLIKHLKMKLYQKKKKNTYKKRNRC